MLRVKMTWHSFAPSRRALEVQDSSDIDASSLSTCEVPQPIKVFQQQTAGAGSCHEHAQHTSQEPGGIADSMPP